MFDRKLSNLVKIFPDERFWISRLISSPRSLCSSLGDVRIGFKVQTFQNAATLLSHWTVTHNGWSSYNLLQKEGIASCGVWIKSMVWWMNYRILFWTLIVMPGLSFKFVYLCYSGIPMLMFILDYILPLFFVWEWSYHWKTVLPLSFLMKAYMIRVFGWESAFVCRKELRHVLLS